MVSSISATPLQNFPSLLAQEPVSRETRMRQCAAIVASLAAVIALSAVGVLPAAIFTVTKIHFVAFAALLGSVALLVAGVVGVKSVMNNTDFSEELEKLNEDLKSDQSSPYEQKVSSMHPLHTCILGPIKEEIVFRGCLQGGLQLALGYVLPVAATAAVAMLVAGSIFGAIHLVNDHKFAPLQALAAGVHGICVLGPLFYHYGLWASCLSHILQNTASISTGIITQAKPIKI